MSAFIMAVIKTFQELKVWQRAHQLVLEIYEITKKFPTEERYALANQVRRAVVSVASNIVEGFNRCSIRDSVHFYTIARASLEEVKYQLLVARDLGYLPGSSYQHAAQQSDEVGKMLNAWLQSQKKHL